MSQCGNNNNTTTTTTNGDGHPPAVTMFTLAVQPGPFERGLYYDWNGELTYGDNGQSRFSFLPAFWEHPDEQEFDPIPVEYRAVVPRIPALTLGLLDDLLADKPAPAPAPAPAPLAPHAPLPVRAPPAPAQQSPRPSRPTSNGPVVSDSGHENENESVSSDSFMRKLLPKLRAVAASAAKRAELRELVAAAESCE